MSLSCTVPLRRGAAGVAKCAIPAFVICALSVAPAAVARGYKVIHNFTGALDGGVPGYTLAVDRKGRFIGAANEGGANGAGTVFRLTHKASGWNFRTLYDFTGKEGQPGWGVTLGPNGSLFTNASYAEVMGGPCGSALELDRAKAPARFAKLQSTLLHTYVNSVEGCPTGNLVRDAAGNLYGVTQDGGANGWGSVIELSPSGGDWTETVLYSFRGAEDGGAPYSEMIFDKAGNLYGTASASTVNFGTVFELSPSGGGWTYKVLCTFTGGDDGGQPVAALRFDKSGNLFGATASWGANGGGTIFELTSSGDSWTFNLLYSLTGSDGPVAALTLNPAGAIYGTNFMDGAYGYGSVFKLKVKDGAWRYRDLHDFTGAADGGYPGGGVVLDANGNLYGTAVLGGADNQGVVYEISR